MTKESEKVDLNALALEVKAAWRKLEDVRLNYESLSAEVYRLEHQYKKACTDAASMYIR